jgi:hypothetical protein
MRLRLGGLLTVGLILLAACGDDAALTTTTEAPTTTTTEAPTTTTTAATTTTSTPTSTTVLPSPCQVYQTALGELNLAMSQEIRKVGAVPYSLGGDPAANREAADEFLLNSDAFSVLRQQLDDLGTPPDPLAEAARLFGLALDRLEQSTLKMSRGVRTNDYSLLVEAVALLEEGTAFTRAYMDAFTNPDGECH